MRIEIQRWLLVGLLAFSYLSRAPGLVQQGWVGIPALIVGLAISVLLIVLIVRSSAKGALTVAILAGFGLVMTLIGQLIVGPHILDVARAPLYSIALLAAFPAVALVLALNLWSAWSRRARTAQ